MTASGLDLETAISINTEDPEEIEEVINQANNGREPEHEEPDLFVCLDECYIYGVPGKANGEPYKSEHILYDTTPDEIIELSLSSRLGTYVRCLLPHKGYVFLPNEGEQYPWDTLYDIAEQRRIDRKHLNDKKEVKNDRKRKLTSALSTNTITTEKGGSAAAATTAAIPVPKSNTLSANLGRTGEDDYPGSHANPNNPMWNPDTNAQSSNTNTNANMHIYADQDEEEKTDEQTIDTDKKVDAEQLGRRKYNQQRMMQLTDNPFASTQEEHEKDIMEDEDEDEDEAADIANLANSNAKAAETERQDAAAEDAKAEPDALDQLQDKAMSYACIRRLVFYFRRHPFLPLFLILFVMGAIETLVVYDVYSDVKVITELYDYFNTEFETTGQPVPWALRIIFVALSVSVLAPYLIAWTVLAQAIPNKLTQYEGNKAIIIFLLLFDIAPIGIVVLALCDIYHWLECFLIRPIYFFATFGKELRIISYQEEGYYTMRRVSEIFAESLPQAVMQAVLLYTNSCPTCDEFSVINALLSSCSVLTMWSGFLYLDGRKNGLSFVEYVAVVLQGSFKFVPFLPAIERGTENGAQINWTKYSFNVDSVGHVAKALNSLQCKLRTIKISTYTITALHRFGCRYFGAMLKNSPMAVTIILSRLEEEIMELFDEYDLDNSKSLDYTEFAHLCLVIKNSSGEPCYRGDIRDVFVELADRIKNQIWRLDLTVKIAGSTARIDLLDYEYPLRRAYETDNIKLISFLMAADYDKQSDENEAEFQYCVVNAVTTGKVRAAFALCEHKGVPLVVRVERGLDLLPMDIDNTSDPYVRVTVFQQIRVTKYRKQTLYPVWNECLLFVIPFESMDALLEGHFVHDAYNARKASATNTPRMNTDGNNSEYPDSQMSYLQSSDLMANNMKLARTNAAANANMNMAVDMDMDMDMHTMSNTNANAIANHNNNAVSVSVPMSPNNNASTPSQTSPRTRKRSRSRGRREAGILTGQIQSYAALDLTKNTVSGLILPEYCQNAVLASLNAQYQSALAANTEERLRIQAENHNNNSNENEVKSADADHNKLAVDMDRKVNASKKKGLKYHGLADSRDLRLTLDTNPNLISIAAASMAVGGGGGGLRAIADGDEEDAEVEAVALNDDNHNKLRMYLSEYPAMSPSYSLGNFGGLDNTAIVIGANNNHHHNHNHSPLDLSKPKQSADAAPGTAQQKQPSPSPPSALGHRLSRYQTQASVLGHESRSGKLTVRMRVFDHDQDSDDDFMGAYKAKIRMNDNNTHYHLQRKDAKLQIRDERNNNKWKPAGNIMYRVYLNAVQTYQEHGIMYIDETDIEDIELSMEYLNHEYPQLSSRTVNNYHSSKNGNQHLNNATDVLLLEPVHEYENADEIIVDAGDAFNVNV